jgi:hypothetical protein
VRVGEAGGEFCGDDYIVAVGLLGHPFADPDLGFFVLVVVGTVGCMLALFVRA